MTNHDTIACIELVNLITDYFDGVLPTDERARFEKHMNACRGCHTYVDQMRRTMQVLGSLPEDAIAPEAAAELLQMFRDWKRSQNNQV